MQLGGEVCASLCRPHSRRLAPMEELFVKRPIARASAGAMTGWGFFGSFGVCLILSGFAEASPVSRPLRIRDARRGFRRAYHHEPDLRRRTSARRKSRWVLARSRSACFASLPASCSVRASARSTSRSASSDSARSRPPSSSTSSSTTACAGPIRWSIGCTADERRR